MLLWMILTLMAVMAAVGLAIPLLRRRDAVRVTRNDSLGVLKAQLGEIETQAATGVLEFPEAEALKSDLKRRVLAEGRREEPAARPLSERTLLYLALGTVAIVTLAGTGLYVLIGKPNTPAAPGVAQPPAGGPQTGAPHGDAAAVIAQLEAQMREHPDNAEGWRMLGWSYGQSGRFAEAATAYGKASALDPSNVDYLINQGESLMEVAQGTVTPAAEGLFRKAIATDPSEPRGHFYVAMARDQSGDHEGAIADWITLLKSAPPGAPWASGVRSLIEKTAAQNKIDVSGRLPALAADAGPRGPTQGQVAAAQTMSDADRQRMIQGMVNGLAARLKQNPKDLAGWQQLMRARMVLGQGGEAAATYRDASRAFAGSPGDQQALKQAAQQLGVPGV